MTVDYTRADPWTMDPTPLRTLIRERAHHTVEIQLYRALARGERLAPETGAKVRELLSVWDARGLPAHHRDLAYVRTLLEMAEGAKRGEAIDLSVFRGQPFGEDDLETVRRLIFGRRSVRHWTGQDVPDTMIDRILEAGLWAAHSCNLNSLRFLVVRENSAPGLFQGAHISGAPVHLVACQDRRVYHCMSGYVANPDRLETNRHLDCGAAMQNMVLMAHALGLGAVWLGLQPPGAARLREHFRLEEHILPVTYMDLGYPAQMPMAPGRISLEDAVLVRT